MLVIGGLVPNVNAAIDPYLGTNITCSKDSNIQVLFDNCAATSIHDPLNRLKPNIASACGEPGSDKYDCCICSNYSAVQKCFDLFCKGDYKLDQNMLSKKIAHCKACQTSNNLSDNDANVMQADGETDKDSTKKKNITNKNGDDANIKPGSKNEKDKDMHKDMEHMTSEDDKKGGKPGKEGSDSKSPSPSSGSLVTGSMQSIYGKIAFSSALVTLVYYILWSIKETHSSEEDMKKIKQLPLQIPFLVIHFFTSAPASSAISSQSPSHTYYLPIPTPFTYDTFS